MSRTPEGKVKREARKIIESFGAYSFMPVTGGYGHSGLFDEVICINGYFVGVEYKAASDKAPTALQTLNAMKCRDSGKGITLLIHKDNLEVLEDTLKKLSELPPPSEELNLWPYTEIPVLRIK